MKSIEISLFVSFSSRFVEFNPINEFTIWRASPLAVDRHRAMLERMGTSQNLVDLYTWQPFGGISMLCIVVYSNAF